MRVPAPRRVLRAWLAACVALVLMAGAPGRALAVGIPPAYRPIVIEPTGAPAKTEFDLTAALARARSENKSLYVYLGASDCRFCRRYEAFLAGHADELRAEFAARYLVVDLRSSLSVPASQLFLKVGAKSLPYAEFQAAIGDERARLLVYPSVWLLDADARPLMQMPSGAGTFQTVPEQLEILRLDQ
jgi:hypothetical protein